MAAAAGWGGAAGSEPAAGGEGAGGAERAWLGGRAAEGEGAGGETKRRWTSLEPGLKRKRRQQEMFLRTSPDPAERTNDEQRYVTRRSERKKHTQTH